MEILKNKLQGVIEYLGDSIEEYNVGAWALFRDIMSADITSHYIFGGGTKPDEDLLGYELKHIKASNAIVKGHETDGKSKEPYPKFTYYVNGEPQDKLEGKPELVDPETAVATNIGIRPHFSKEQSIKSSSNGVETFYEYDERSAMKGFNERIINGNNYSIDINGYDGNTLLSKTRKMFQDEKNKRFATIISGFHTNQNKLTTEDLDNNVGINSYTKDFGQSKAKNLLRVDANGNADKGNTVNGYTDPYCRVWTWHKQYDSLDDTIRPFPVEGEGMTAMGELDNGDSNWRVFRSDNGFGFAAGGERLGKYGKMYDNSGSTNGLVNITPQTKDGRMVVDVTKCMFSIENLAWKGTFNEMGDDENGLSREQKGPLGGRIMWFPPYGLTFDESTNANWSTNEFIGRGEPIFTYANTVRSGTLSFKMLIDHPAILDYWERRADTTSYNQENSGPDDVKSKEQEMLRFFAGCSVLKASKTQGLTEMTVYDENGNARRKEDVVDPETSTIQFLIFYPNNYSGKDDNSDKAVNYLVNGVGCGDDGEFGDTMLFKYFIDSKQVGGYEMRNGVGVSLVQEETTTNAITAVDIQNAKNGVQTTIILKKMCGKKASAKEYDSTWSDDKKKEWHKRRYYYRADKETLDQVLVGEANEGAVSYIDKSSTCLNSSGYMEGFNSLKIQPETSIRCSLTEMYVAFNGDEYNIFDGLYDSKAVETIKNIVTGKGTKITDVISYGYASFQGNNPSADENKRRNTTLASQRADTARKWMQKMLNSKSDIAFKVGSFSIGTKENGKIDDSNDHRAKLQRCALVEIHYKKEATENAGETNPGSPLTAVAGDTPKEAPIPPNEASGNTRTQGTSVGSINGRYDNEARFFTRLEKEAPFMAKLLSERINNFNPVFHSMTPEGCNARLTFLNQCMRQGPTISGSDTEGLNSNNLAFGRAPVCVLRIGDFYNTKVIFTNLTIRHDPLVWDLNQEGIGVMPMIYDISLTFNFIGGSDLGGPIQRLQNATSFNYYANTNVYDNRAEAIDYKDKDTVEFKAYDPYIYPNK